MEARFQPRKLIAEPGPLTATCLSPGNLWFCSKIKARWRIPITENLSMTWLSLPRATPQCSSETLITWVPIICLIDIVEVLVSAISRAKFRTKQPLWRYSTRTFSPSGKRWSDVCLPMWILSWEWSDRRGLCDTVPECQSNLWKLIKTWWYISFFEFSWLPRTTLICQYKFNTADFYFSPDISVLLCKYKILFVKPSFLSDYQINTGTEIFLCILDYFYELDTCVWDNPKSKGMNIFKVLDPCFQITLQKDWTNLYSHQQCMKIYLYANSKLQSLFLRYFT